MRLFEYEQVDSTMLVAQKWVLDHPHALENAIFLAKEQTAGRGQYGRSWVSEPGNLYATLVFVPPIQEEVPLQFVSIMVGLAVRKALERLIPQEGDALKLKWPNDILWQGAKVGGILIQKEMAIWLIGIGINVEHHPEVTEYPATSLSNVSGLKIDKKVLIQEIFNDFLYFWNILPINGFEILRDLWMKAAFGLQTKVTVAFAPQATMECIFQGIDGAGLPLFQGPQGIIKDKIPQKIFWDGYHKN